MKITIVGAGAIGGVIGAYLAKGGRNIEFVDVVEEHIEALKTHGIQIIAQEETFTVPVKAYTPEKLLQKQETLQCLLLCVKAQHTQKALQPFLPMMDKNSFVVSVQNGLCEMEIAELIGMERTVGGFVNIFADYLEPGVISYGGKGELAIGELNGKTSPRLKALERAMSVLDRITISANIPGFLWAKLAYGAILTATALTNETIADIIDNHRYRNMLMNIAAEVLAVADYAGVKAVAFDDWNPEDAYPIENRNNEQMNKQLDVHVKRLRSYSKVYSGIWRDIVVRKRKTEKPYHFIPVFKLATEANLDMPLCKLLLAMLSEVEIGKRPLSIDNLEVLFKKNQNIYQ